MTLGPEMLAGSAILSRRQWLANDGVKLVVCAALVASADPDLAYPVGAQVLPQLVSDQLPLVAKVRTLSLALR